MVMDTQISDGDNWPWKRRTGAERDMVKAYMSPPRRRKEVPCFRKVDLSESDFKRIVGKRIKVYWDGSRKWFTGKIESFDSKKKQHRVLYDDGDVEELYLLDERFELEVVTSECFTLHSSLRKNSINRELGSASKNTNVGDSLADSVSNPVGKIVAKVSGKPYMALPEITDRRKEVLCFRKVELNESDFDRIVGKRIKVYWEGSRKWFTGCVESFDSKQKLHRILYNDGDVEELNLLDERFELEVVTSEGFTPCSSLRTSSINREPGLVGKNPKVGDSTAGSVHKPVQKIVTEVSEKPYMTLPEITRRRKEVPSFRKVELNESDFDRIVGKRIKVYWEGSRKWFTGRIESFDNEKKLHRILYNDGDVEELNLLDERFELEVVTSEGFTPCSSLRTNSINREPGSVGKNTNVGDSIAGSVNKPVEKIVMKVSEKPSMALPEITPRRKEVPSFRKVELNESDFDRIVGKRIKVYWEGSRKWFTGRIESFHNEKKLHRVLYNDGDVEDLYLLIARFELEVVTSEGFTLCSSLRTNSIDRELGSVGKKTNVEDSLAESVNKPVEKIVMKVSEKPSMALPEMTRRRKEVLSFRKVELNESDFDRVVGKRIRVYWEGSRKWFTGRIESFHNEKKLHRVLYNDGDVEDLNLLIARFELEVFASEGFTLCSSLRTNSINRELGSVGKKTNVEDSLAESVNKPVEKIIMKVSEKPSMALPEMTRRRKEVPSFRKVELNESDFDRVVGKRIKVYWDGSRKWFTGHIESFDNEKKLHRILYNDGDVEELNLPIEHIELEVVTSEGFTLHSSLRKNSKQRAGFGW